MNNTIEFVQKKKEEANSNHIIVIHCKSNVVQFIKVTSAQNQITPSLNVFTVDRHEHKIKLNDAHIYAITYSETASSITISFKFYQ